MLVYETKPLTHVFAEAAQTIINCFIPFFQLHHTLSHQVGTSLSAFDPRGERGNLGPEFCHLRVDVIEAHFQDSESVENSKELFINLNPERAKPIIERDHPRFKRTHPLLQRGNATIKRSQVVRDRGQEVLDRGHAVLKHSQVAFKRDNAVIKHSQVVFDRGDAVLECDDAFCDAIFEHLQLFAERNEFRVEVSL